MTRFNDLNIHVHLHIPPDPRINQILNALNSITEQETEMAVDLTSIKSAAAEQVTVDASVEALLTSIVQSFVDAASSADAATQTAIQAVADGITAENANLAAAVVANTPVVDPPVEEPTV